ncbi:MAG: hypothetical protein IT416_01760, partial [Candidatus Pacebacteria bacterium]|nr:hypothetical protein [Candidatus Paceibacterota bacterium]
MIFKRSTLSLFLLLVAVTPSWAFITYQKSQKQVEEKLAEPVINGKVLGEYNTNEQLLFSVNIPAIFKENITAPNIIYSIQAGKGISVTGDQNSTIINTGVTSLQGGTGDLVLTAGTGINLDGLTINNSSNIFKTISIDGQTDVIADSQTDSLTFVGSGVTITTDADNDRITFSAQEPDYSQSGWTDNGSNIVLTNTSDTVTVDSFTAGAITADSLTTSGLALAGGLTVTSGNSILPDTDLGSDLGSASYRFNNLYVGNINSNASVSYSGQTTFSYEPTTTNYLEAAVIINPTNPINNGQLLGIGIAGYQRVLIDEDGDLVLGYSDQISAPTTDYPLNIYGHSGTRVAYIDTSGNETLSGHLALGGATVSGTYALNVNGYIYSNSGVTAVSYPATNSGSAASPIFRWWSDSDTGMFSPGTDTLGFSTAGVEAVRINSSGNVGIKTTNPQYELDIAGNMRTANGYLTIFSSSNIPYLSSINGVNLRLTSGGSVADSNGLTINTGGNVGIGTISPTYKLHVAGNIAASSTISGSGLYTAGSTYTSSIYMYPGLNSDLPIHNSTAGRTVKLSTTQAGGTANTNQLYLDSTGNVGIGTNLPGVKLDVSGAIKFGSAAGTYDILNTTTAGGASSGNLYWGNSTIIDSNNISSFSVVSVANSDNTLTVSPTTGDATVSLNLDNANTWTGLQTFNNTYTDFAQYIRHAGDNDTFLNFTDDSLIIQIGNEPLAFLTENGAQDIVKLGDGGDVDINLNDDLFVEGSSGNVGIGTSSPNSTLNAYYNYGTTDTNLRDVITIDRTTGSAGVAGMGGALLFRNRNYASSQINAGRIGVINTQNVLNNEQPAMVFQTGNNGSITETMRLTYDGKLGIGINTSSAKLAVQGTSTNDLAQFYD